MRSSMIIPNGIIQFHRLCHPIGRHPIGHHPISIITCHCAQSTLKIIPKNHLRDEFVVKKQVVSTPATSRFFAVGRGVYIVYFVSFLLGVERFFFPRIGICSILVCWLETIGTLPIMVEGLKLGRRNIRLACWMFGGGVGYNGAELEMWYGIWVERISCNFTDGKKR